MAFLCGCAPATAHAPPLRNRSSGPPRTDALDRLGFIAGCWQEITRYPEMEHRFCWSREPGRWHGVLTLRPGRSEELTHYFIKESPEGLVLEYGRQQTTTRVLASRVEPHAIAFWRPDPPDGRMRGPDLSLQYKPSSHALHVAVFDVLHYFIRAR